MSIYKKVVLFAYEYLVNNYKMVFVPRWDIDFELSADLVKLSRAPIRIGFSEKVTEDKKYHNMLRDKYFSSVFFCRADCLESEKYLNLLEQMKLTVYDRDVKLPYKNIKEYRGVRLDKPYAALAIDTSSEYKDWNIANYVIVANWLYTQGITTVLLGTNSFYNEKFKLYANGLQYVSLVGETSVRDTFDIIGSSCLYIGGDTGLSHIAGAVGAKGIVVNGWDRNGDPKNSRSPVRFRPKSDLIKVIQPKNGSGVNQVTPNEVIELIKTII